MKNVIERVFFDLAGPAPWTVHAEWCVGGRVDCDQLKFAAAQTMLQHPLLDARHNADGRWVVSNAPPRPDVGLYEGAEPDSSAEVRGRLVSRQFDLGREAPIRFDIVREPLSDHVVAVADHALVDGVGIGRTIASLISNYLAGWPGEVDENWREARALKAASPQRERVRSTVLALRRRSSPVAVRLARECAEPKSGYGVVYHDVTPKAHATLFSYQDGASTVNDVVLAAFCLAGMAWNRDHGSAATPFSIGVPVNLRPARRWLSSVCNATMLWPVRVDVDRPREVLRQISDQLRPVRLGIYSTDVRAVLTYLRQLDTVPVRVRHALATTTVVSTVPGVDSLCEDASHVPVIVGGAPAPASMGMTFAVIPGSCTHRFSARYLRSHYCQSAAQRYLAEVDNTIVRLAGRDGVEAG